VTFLPYFTKDQYTHTVSDKMRHDAPTGSIIAALRAQAALVTGACASNIGLSSYEAPAGALFCMCKPLCAPVSPCQCWVPLWSQFNPKISHLCSSDIQLEVMRFEDMIAAMSREDIDRAVRTIVGAYRRFRTRRRLWRFIYQYEKEVRVQPTWASTMIAL
jgi:hypothetical protein